MGEKNTRGRRGGFTDDFIKTNCRAGRVALVLKRRLLTSSACGGKHGWTQLRQEADRKMNPDLFQPYFRGLTTFRRIIRKRGFPAFRELARFLLFVGESQIPSCICQILPVPNNDRPSLNRFVQAPVHQDQFSESLLRRNLYWLPVNRPTPPAWSV